MPTGEYKGNGMCIDAIVHMLHAEYASVCNAKSKYTCGSAIVDRYVWDEYEKSLYIWIE